MKIHILSKHPTIHQKHNPGTTNVTNSFDMGKEIALTNAQKTAPYPIKYLVHIIHLTDSIPSYMACVHACVIMHFGVEIRIDVNEFSYLIIYYRYRLAGFNFNWIFDTMA